MNHKKRINVKKRIPQTVYKDEKNQKRCSTCDIKIESQYDKPCECGFLLRISEDI